jgi:hypothetical protein
MEDADVLAAARAAIREFGDSAHQIMDRRADAHRRFDEEDGERFWQRVAETVRDLQLDRSK